MRASMALVSSWLVQETGPTTNFAALLNIAQGNNFWAAVDFEAASPLYGSKADVVNGLRYLISKLRAASGLSKTHQWQAGRLLLGPDGGAPRPRRDAPGGLGIESVLRWTQGKTACGSPRARTSPTFGLLTGSTGIALRGRPMSIIRSTPGQPK